MRKWIISLLLLLLLAAGLLTAKQLAESAVQRTLFQPEEIPAAAPRPTAPAAPVPETAAPPESTAAAAMAATVSTLPADPPAQTTVPAVLTFTEEEEALLLQIGAAERGSTGCTECIALVMRTVLNRVESPKFSSAIKGVIYAQDQFTPVMDGSFGEAVPDWYCREALDMVKQGWDESQGALYYEWCEGESWHSQNLNLLFQHCDTRFYN